MHGVAHTCPSQRPHEPFPTTPLVAHNSISTHLVAHGVPNLAAQLLRHALGGADGSHTAGLRDANLGGDGREGVGCGV